MQWEYDRTWPDCVEGNCLAAIDKLTPDIVRALGLKNILASFSEMNIGQVIVEQYEITFDDLNLISMILAEERDLEQERQKEQRRAHGG